MAASSGYNALSSIDRLVDHFLARALPLVGDDMGIPRGKRRLEQIVDEFVRLATLFAYFGMAQMVKPICALPLEGPSRCRRRSSLPRAFAPADIARPANDETDFTRSERVENSDE